MHRAQSLLVGQRTQLVNMMHSMLAEIGITIPEGLEKALSIARQIVDGEVGTGLPVEATMVVAMPSQQVIDTSKSSS